MADAPISPRRRAVGSVLAFVGFMLSPLSWWNDAFVNVPLAYGAAWLVSLACHSAFTVAWAVAYLLTNALGFALLHWGIAMNVSERKPMSSKALAWQLFAAAAYTALIFVLAHYRIVPIPSAPVR